MIVRNIVGARASVRVALFSVAVALVATVGCGGADQSDGSAVVPDPSLDKQQDDMRQYYQKNPLPKPKKQP